MEAVGFGEVVHNLVQARHALASADKAAVDSHEQSSHAEAAAASGDHVLIVAGVDAVEVNAFGSQTGGRLGALPHIVEVHFLNVVEESVVVGKRTWAVRHNGVLPRVWRLWNRACRRTARSEQHSNGSQCINNSVHSSI